LNWRFSLSIVWTGIQFLPVRALLTSRLEWVARLSGRWSIASAQEVKERITKP
jgi:hypothetical protein